jgi:hypothetical protein
MAGRNGRDTEVIASSTVAARRIMTPGTRNGWEAMWESEEREEEDAGKCIIRKVYVCFTRRHGAWMEPLRDVRFINSWELISE